MVSFNAQSYNAQSWDECVTDTMSCIWDLYSMTEIYKTDTEIRGEAETHCDTLH